MTNDFTENSMSIRDVGFSEYTSKVEKGSKCLICNKEYDGFDLESHFSEVHNNIKEEPNNDNSSGSFHNKCANQRKT